MTVYTNSGNDTWSEVSGLTGINLSAAAKSWNKYVSAATAQSSSFRIKIQPINPSSAPESGISEIEFWAEGDRMNVKNAEALSSVIDETKDFLSFGRKYSAIPQENSVTVTRVKEQTTVKDAVFTIKRLEINNVDITRAWLTYELKGFGSWIGLEKTINGMGLKIAWPMAGTTEWQNQSEPINPDLLVKGDNEIAFKLPTGAAEGYSVRNLQLVIETDNGFNNISGVEPVDAETSKMLDGDTASSWKPLDGNSLINLNLHRPAQISAVNMQISGKITGEISIIGSSAGKEEVIADSISGETLSDGWNKIDVLSESAIDSLTISINASVASSGKIAEIAACGSGIGSPRKADIIINYPKEGQYFGRSAYITGFLPVTDNGSGTAQVLVGPNPVELKDGVFAGIVSKEDVGLEADEDSKPWSVDVTLLYPDGEKIVNTVKLDSMQTDADGNEAGNNDAYSVTYGFGVKGGKFKRIKIKGMEMEVEAEDEDKTENIQVLDLKENFIPPLEMGMVNVTGGGKKAYRFLPHHSKFKCSKSAKLGVSAGFMT